MAVILSTVDGVGQLTGNQHRNLNHALSKEDDYIILGAGSQFLSTYSGWDIVVQPGMAVLMGTLVEISANELKTFNAGGVSGTAMVILRVNLNTKVASVELVKTTTLQKDNLVTNPSGIREYELYRFTHSASSITGFTDKRILTTKKLVVNSDDSVADIRVVSQATYDAIATKDPKTIYMILKA